MRLRPVTQDDAQFLYELLAERPATANISHKAMPSYEEHQAFVADHPYKAWYILVASAVDPYPVGSIYLTDNDEIGIFVAKQFQGKGFAELAIDILRKLHPAPRFLANINPNNQASKALFTKLGFKHIQNTYELTNG